MGREGGAAGLALVTAPELRDGGHTLSISAKTRVYGLIGDPVSHSLSPFIMNRAFEEHGIDCVYVDFHVRRGELPEALRGLRALGVAGANVTHPYKEAATSLIDSPSPLVKILKASNTLCFTPEAVLGYNTDAAGAAIALERIGDCPPEGKKVLVYGAGGAGRAVAFGCLEAGAASVTFCVRDTAKTHQAVSPLRDRFADKPLSVIAMGEQDRDERRRAVIESDIIVNATPLGQADGNGLIVEPAWIGPSQLCFDLVYGESETKFLKTAGERGATCLGGTALLVAQASEGLRHWTGTGFDVVEMMKAVEAHASRMPGQGGDG